MKLPIIEVVTYGINACIAISGSLVSFLEIQLEGVPLVTNPVKSKIARLKRPIAWTSKLYRGSAYAWLWVRLRMRKQASGP
jgi:hypothetical protein